MVFVFGGGATYKGRDLRDVHYDLITKKGLNLQHFDLTAQHFKDTLTELKLPQVRSNEGCEMPSAPRK